MAKMKSASGRIVRLVARDTRYGRRAEALLERIDQATGEVFEARIKAWGALAYELEDHRLGGSVGVTGYSRTEKDGKGMKRRMLIVRHVAALRHIDPRTIDISRYA